MQNVKPDNDKMKTVEKIEALKFKVVFNRSNTDPRGYGSITAKRSGQEITAPTISSLLKRVKKQPKYYTLIFEDRIGNQLKTVDISAGSYQDAILQKKIAFQNSLINNLFKIRISK